MALENNKNDNSFQIDNEVNEIDMEKLTDVVNKLVKNYKKLDYNQKLSTINLILKLALSRDTVNVVIPPM